MASGDRAEGQDNAAFDSIEGFQRIMNLLSGSGPTNIPMYDLEGVLTTLPQADMPLYRAAQRDLEHNRNIQALHLSNTAVIGAFGGELICVSRALYERLVLIQFRSRRPTPGLTKRQLNESTITYPFKAKRKRVEESETTSVATGSTAKAEVGGAATSKEHEDNSNECYICYEKFVNNNKLRRLPCMHTFHMRCVDRWLKLEKTCPTCRLAVPINYTSLMQNLNAGMPLTCHNTW